MDWTELGQQLYRRGSTAPTPALTSAHSRQQITNVEATSGHPAVLPFTWAPTAREQLASHFIVPPPAPQHNPSTLSFSAGSYSSAHFRAHHLKNLPEALAPTARDRLAYQRTAAFYHAARITSPTGRKAHFSNNISRMLLPPPRAHCRRRPNKRAPRAPQQIFGIGASLLLSILRPAALDLSLNWLT